MRNNYGYCYTISKKEFFANYYEMLPIKFEDFFNKFLMEYQKNY